VRGEGIGKNINTNRYRRGRIGAVNIDAIYTASDGSRKRIKARSSFSYMLQNKKQRELAIIEAIDNGKAIAGFTPMDVELIDFWFEYWEDE